MKPLREVIPDPVVVERLPDLAQDQLPDLAAWLAAQASQYALQWLLAHLDDGVVWGVLEPGDSARLALSTEAAPEVSPPLRARTLQAARLFGPVGELYVWRQGHGFGQRLIRATAPGETPRWVEAFDEKRILWGNSGTPVGSFTLLEDGAQGMHHAVPWTMPGAVEGQKRHNIHPPRLQVRHYLSASGVTCVEASRLVDLMPDDRPEDEDEGEITP